MKRQYAADVASRLGVKPTSELRPTAELLSGCSLVFTNSTPLDIVYTWVNWTHPAYVAQMDRSQLKHAEAGMRYEQSSGTGSYNELLYSLNSLASTGFLDRVRRIHVLFNPIHGRPECDLLERF